MVPEGQRSPAAPLPSGNPSRQPVVLAESIWRRFGERAALTDVSFSAEAGEIHALLGPNGAGKTTLIRILAGLTTPTEGRLTLLGRDGAANDRRRRQNIGLVPSG